jgi:hypothetical protein
VDAQNKPARTAMKEVKLRKIENIGRENAAAE